MSEDLKLRSHSNSLIHGRSFTLRNLQQALYTGDDDSKGDISSSQIAQQKEVERATVLKASKQRFEYFVNNDAPTILRNLGVADASKEGLSDQEAQIRLEEYGRNELDKAPPRSLFWLFLDQFSDLLVIMLIVAAVVSMALGQYPESVTILMIVMANAVLGVVQEARAGAALDALESMASPLTTVRRSGKVKQVSSDTLVPGDVVVLGLGDKISADIRLIAGDNMVSNEMALTGESEGVKKDYRFVGEGSGSMRSLNMVVDDHHQQQMPEGGNKKPEPVPLATTKEKEKKKEAALTDPNMVYMGCAVMDGRGEGVVVKTGMDTKMGEVAHLLNTADKGESPLQGKLHALGIRLGLASIAISVVVFVVGVTTERGADPNSDQAIWLQMLLVAVSLTVAAVPESLPAAVTITLAIGMRNMVKKNALIRNLHSVETLGSASVVCSDKTGTLTAGAMTSVRLWYDKKVFRITGTGYNPKGFVLPEKVDPQRASESQVTEAANDILNGPHTSILLAGALCSDAKLQFDEKEDRWECVGNSSERPLVVAAAKVGIEMEEMNHRHYKRLKNNPFNSKRKMMSVLVENNSDPSSNYSGDVFFNTAKRLAVVKGAPNIILNHCTHISRGENCAPENLTDKDREAVLAQIDRFSLQAFRVLACAYKPVDEDLDDDSPAALENGLVLCGLVASIDPERPEVIPSIQKAYGAGIRVVMITGDYVKTAKAIAENIGLLPKGSPEDKAIDCALIRKYGNSLTDLKKHIDDSDGKSKDDLNRLKARKAKLETELDEITAYTDVYARAKPVDKITIVRSLQRQGNVCSMTGDGVNDAPALKQANIGVAMGITGTDVAKASADMVLTDDNFVSIIEAIEEGRTIYANISKFVFYLLSTNVSEVFLILIGTIIGLQVPLVPIQILWLNLATDGAPAVALAFEKTEPGIMQEGPRPPTENIIEKLMITGMCVHTVILTSVTLVTFILGMEWQTGSWDGSSASGEALDDAVEHARTMTIFVIVLAELMRAYTSRSMRASLFSIGVFSNKYMQMAAGTAIFLTFLFGLVPGIQDLFGMTYLTGREYAWVFSIIWVPAIGDEVLKYWYRRSGFGKRPKVRSDEGKHHSKVGLSKKQGFASFDDEKIDDEDGDVEDNAGNV